MNILQNGKYLVTCILIFYNNKLIFAKLITIFFLSLTIFAGLQLFIYP